MSRRRKLLVAFGLPLLVGLLVLALCPQPDLYGDAVFSTAVVDRDGRLLRLELADDDRYRLRVRLADVAPAAIEATLLYEDRYFYSHPGFNPAALLRAAWSTYVRRGRVIGASTITMQLARLRFGLDTRSIGGKLVQIGRAVQLERHYSKNEILEAYLNLAPYGGNVEGIAAASRVYFRKPPSELGLGEALALAVIPQNPTGRNPSTPAGRAELTAARARLLAILDAQRGVGAELRTRVALPLSIRDTRSLPFGAPHFVQSVLATNSARPVIETTLDSGKQALLEARIRSYVERKRSLGIANASAMLVDTRTMEVLASVGSADFFDDSLQGQVDGTAAKRSPGSTLKPFLYGLAIDAGLVHPATLLKDAPRRFAAYTPENFDRGFMGPITAQDALVYSRNVPAIELLSEIGIERFQRLLVDARVRGLREPDYYGLAMILGGNELTMRELVVLYAMLANGGVAKPLVTQRAAPPEAFSQRLLSPEASFLVLDMLRHNPRPDALGIGTADAAIPVAWKTGTSYAFRDAWAVGDFGPYVLAVWVGNFDGSGNPAFVGRSAAAPLFFEIADALTASLPGQGGKIDPPAGLNLRRIDVCADTGDLPGRYCPRTQKSWFIPGVSPIRVSNVFRGIRIDNETGKRACGFDAARTHIAVYEFWPSDILGLFRRAGISIRQPPPWAPDCGIESQRTTGLAPQIRSPSAGLAYQLRLRGADAERIPLEATTDSDVGRLYWFVDDRFVGEVRRDDPVFWRPEAGTHRVLAVDDLGRSDSRILSVVAVP